MPCHSLPAEILDLIVDNLRDNPATLEACCLVSKSWIPRTRRHLFSFIELADSKTVKSWIRVFPDPSNSPAHHTRKLRIRGLETITAADALIHVHSFHCLTELKLQMYGPESRRITLARLHGLSPTLKSLLLSYSYIPPWEVLDLICSFPLLEDLTLRSGEAESSTKGWNVPPISPRFTGSLRLVHNNSTVARRLFDLPNSIHFSKVILVFPTEDMEFARDLVLRCSETMEFLRIDYYPSAFPPISLCLTKTLSLLIGPFVAELPLPLDLSNATKLRDMEIWWSGNDAQWIAMTLQTVPSKSLHQITLRVFTNFAAGSLTEERLREWGEVDRSLVQLWTSRSIFPKVLYYDYQGGTVPKLFPELMKKGAVREVGCD
jgi:hypothetical protein